MQFYSDCNRLKECCSLCLFICSYIQIVFLFSFQRTLVKVAQRTNFTVKFQFPFLFLITSVPVVCISLPHINNDQTNSRRCSGHHGTGDLEGQESNEGRENESDRMKEQTRVNYGHSWKSDIMSLTIGS